MLRTLDEARQARLDAERAGDTVAWSRARAVEEGFLSRVWDEHKHPRGRAGRWVTSGMPAELAAQRDHELRLTAAAQGATPQEFIRHHDPAHATQRVAEHQKSTEREAEFHTLVGRLRPGEKIKLPGTSIIVHRSHSNSPLRHYDISDPDSGRGIRHIVGARHAGTEAHERHAMVTTGNVLTAERHDPGTHEEGFTPPQATSRAHFKRHVATAREVVDKEKEKVERLAPDGAIADSTGTAMSTIGQTPGVADVLGPAAQIGEKVEHFLGAPSAEASEGKAVEHLTRAAPHIAHHIHEKAVALAHHVMAHALGHPHAHDAARVIGHIAKTLVSGRYMLAVAERLHCEETGDTTEWARARAREEALREQVVALAESFDPFKHPRDRSGRWRETLGALARETGRTPKGLRRAFTTARVGQASRSVGYTRAVGKFDPGTTPASFDVVGKLAAGASPHDVVTELSRVFDRAPHGATIDVNGITATKIVKEGKPFRPELPKPIIHKVDWAQSGRTGGHFPQPAASMIVQQAREADAAAKAPKPEPKKTRGKQTLTHVLPDGTVETRQTTRPYTHVVTTTGPEPGDEGNDFWRRNKGRRRVVSWHASKALADKAAEQHKKHGYQAVRAEPINPEGKADPGTGKAVTPTAWLDPPTGRHARVLNAEGAKVGKMDPGDRPKTTLGVTPYYKDDDPSYPRQSFDDAKALFSSAEWQAKWQEFERDMSDMAAEHKVTVVGQTRTVGVYEGEFEPSYSIEVTGDPAAVESYNKALGSKWNQDAVVSFTPHPEGSDAQVALSGSKNPDEVFAKLKDLGVEGATFSPEGTSVTVFVYGGDAKMVEKLRDFAQAHDMIGEYTRGNGSYHALKEAQMPKDDKKLSPALQALKDAGFKERPATGATKIVVGLGKKK